MGGGILIQHRRSSKKQSSAPAKAAKPPICVTHESKLPVFQPTRRPSQIRQQCIETAYGSVTITGKLGQGHRDVLDAVMACAEGGKTVNGQLSVLVDPYQLRKMVSIGHDGGLFPYAHIRRLLRDMRMAEVDMVMPALNLRVIDGILASIEESHITKESQPWEFQAKPDEMTRPMLPNGHRPMLTITFGKNWTRMLATDLPVAYRLPIIIAMRHGASQATARYCLSHQEVHDTMDGILVKIGYDPDSKTPRAVQKVKAELRQDAEALAALGVILTDKDTVHRG